MNEIEYIPIAALNQYAYCFHRYWRMFCAGEFADNQYTIEGTSLHDRVHTFGEGHRERTWQIRAIWLKSEQYKLIGKADLIEESDGHWYPIEYKRGHRGEWDNDELQVCAQALCLEEMLGQTITQCYIYYAILRHDVQGAVNVVGFDPYLGYLHVQRYGRPGLALDLMEEFRPLVVDAMVLSAINRRSLTLADFTTEPLSGAVSLSDEARRTFLRLYEQKKQSQFKHPVLGRKCTYQEAFEIQARLLAKYLMGEIDKYPPLVLK